MRTTFLILASALVAAAQTPVAPSPEKPGDLEKAGAYTVTNSYEVGYRFADVSGAGHMVAGDRNDVFSSAVLAFLREALGRPAELSVAEGEPA